MAGDADPNAIPVPPGWIPPSSGWEPPAGQPFAGQQFTGQPPAQWGVSGYDGVTFPAARPQTRARTAWILAAIAGMVLSGFVGLTVGYYIGGHRAQISASAQVAGAGTGSCRVPAASAGQLVAVQLLPVPAGSSITGSGTQRVLTVQQYANMLYSGRPGETTELRSLCFQTAAHLMWREPSGKLVSIWLIQFGNPDQARSYARYTEQGDLAAAANTSHFPVSGVADGIGIATPSVDKYGFTLTRALGDKGSVVVLMHVFALGKVAPPAEVRALLRAQDARIG
jgi:hypothetical protein